MNTLIIILIIVMIVQSAIFTYSHFFDVNVNKQAAVNMNMLETALQKYVANEKQLQTALTNKDIAYYELKNVHDKLVEMHNMTVHYLPNIYQKEAMRQIINGEVEQHPECIDTLKEYYDWIKQLKYNDTEKPLEK